MSAITGTLRLARLAARRERLRIPIWIVGLSTLLAAQAAGNAETYPTEAERASAAAVLAANPALRMMRGSAADTSSGALLVSDAFWILAILTALLSAFTVVRHTRQDEETGRGELIGAAPVGSHAGLAASLILGIAMNTALASALALALIVSGLPIGGSLTLGAAVGATGLAFVGIGAIAAQLSPSGRTANAFSVVAIGIAYVLRAIGDALGDLNDDGTTATSAWPSWFSPIGWGQQVKAFAENDWWPLALSMFTFLAASAIAVRLLGRRDFGQGLFPQRLGPPAAPTTLLQPFGLAWRMQRGTLAGWSIGMVALGGVFGSIGRQIDDLSSNDDFLELLAGLGASSDAIAETYFAAAMTIIGTLVACYPLQAIVRLEGDESEGRLEPVLATGVSRIRWLLIHLLLTAVAVLVLLTLAGGAAGLVHGLLAGDVLAQLPSLTGAALVHAPGALTLCGLAVAVFGLVPRWSTAVAWTALAAALLLGPLGEALGLPDSLRDVSPFTHTPAAPAADVTAGPLLSLTLVALFLTAVGVFAFNRRDLALRA